MSLRRENMSMKLLGVLVFLIAVSSLVFITGKPRTPNLVIATDASYPPMEYKSDSNEIIGLDIDLINAVTESGGFTVEIVNDHFS